MDRPLLRERIDAWVDPEIVFAQLYAASENAFWLDRGVHARTGMSHMGDAAPGACVVITDAQGRVGDPRAGETIFDFLDRELSHAAGPAGAADPAQCDAFAPAWIGWLGYEAGAQLAGSPVCASRYPGAAMLFAQRAVSFDHASRCLMLSAPDDEAGRAWLHATRASVAGCVGLPPRRQAAAAVATSGSWRHRDTDYLQLIAEAQAAIARGDVYQLCLTNELTAPVVIDPYETYRALRLASPTDTGGYLRFGALSLLSASPERFLTISGDGLVTTRPIKGTRPRGIDEPDDLRLRAELHASDKERAENLMIVDLMRNDLGRIARLGTVEVTDLLTVESYAQVHQLVSTVRARLPDGANVMGAVRACFPAGSMTGAPKLAAMRILHELERGPRGVYSGCFGRFCLDGRVELSMVIRSIVADASSVSIGSGGGITGLSIPEEELAEVRLKAAALAEIVGVSVNVG